MKPYHRSCGSTALRTHVIKKRGRFTTIDHCVHCKRDIESFEVGRVDSRLSTMTYKGKVFFTNK